MGCGVKMWKLGATLSAMTCCIALIAQAVLPSESPNRAREDSSVWSFDYFDAWWQVPSPDCELSNTCVFIVIKETRKCSKDILIDFTVTDSNDLFLSSQTKVIEHRHFKSGSIYEIGTDTPKVGYFAIDGISCSAGWDTTVHEI
jgi:hypothetical protein